MVGRLDRGLAPTLRPGSLSRRRPERTLLGLGTEPHQSGPTERFPRDLGGWGAGMGSDTTTVRRYVLSVMPAKGPAYSTFVVPRTSRVGYVTCWRGHRTALARRYVTYWTIRMAPGTLALRRHLEMHQTTGGNRLTWGLPDRWLLSYYVQHRTRHGTGLTVP